MMGSKNEIKVYTTSNGAELNISAPSTKQVISATNNRAQYYAEQAKKYRDEAKMHKENAQYYAEQNSDVTFEYIDDIKNSLEDKINEKQEAGNYALKEELPTLVSELENDANYVNDSTFNLAVEELKLPEKEGFSGCFLRTNGEECHWAGINSFQLFDTKLTDKVLSYNESQGWALQGTFVYKEALAGTRYGYPDFYNKCLEEYNQATNTETVNGVTVKVHSNGHKYYNISNKSNIDNFFNTNGSAWFYGVDTTNKRIFLPRDKYFSIKNVSKTAPVAGTGIVLGLTNGAGNNGGLVAGANSAVYGRVDGFGKSLPCTNTATATLGANQMLGVTTDASKSGIVANTSNIIQFNENKYLYICVGNIINYEGMTNIVNQGMDILEQVNEGINSCVHIDGSNA
jgi:gas vesicle protein